AAGARVAAAAPRTAEEYLNRTASLVTLGAPIWPSPRGAASTTRGCAAGILTGHQRLDLLPRCQRITRPRPWPRGVIYGSKLLHTPAPAARTSRRRARRDRGTDENQAIAARSARARRPQVLAYRCLQAVVGPQLRAGDRRRRRRRRPRVVRPLSGRRGQRRGDRVRTRPRRLGKCRFACAEPRVVAARHRRQA